MITLHHALYLYKLGGEHNIDAHGHYKDVSTYLPSIGQPAKAVQAEQGFVPWTAHHQGGRIAIDQGGRIPSTIYGGGGQRTSQGRMQLHPGRQPTPNPAHIAAGRNSLPCPERSSERYAKTARSGWSAVLLHLNNCRVPLINVLVTVGLIMAQF
jgi:hypothetical protein